MPLQAETPVKVGATAGLRLLPGGQSDAIPVGGPVLPGCLAFQAGPQEWRDGS